jgi:hypothetical protein
VLTVEGKPVWKKWLGDPLMSMPALAGERIYQVYPDSRGDRRHYLAAFDLTEGRPRRGARRRPGPSGRPGAGVGTPPLFRQVPRQVPRPGPAQAGRGGGGEAARPPRRGGPDGGGVPAGGVRAGPLPHERGLPPGVSGARGVDGPRHLLTSCRGRGPPRSVGPWPCSASSRR